MSTGQCATHEYAGHFRHDDGWGAAAVLEGSDTVAVFRSALPLSQSAAGESVAALHSQALVVHARAASQPAQRGLAYAHPIEATIGAERVWFFHNGFCPAAHELVGRPESGWDSEDLLTWLLPAFSAENWRTALRARLGALPAGTANCVFLFSRRFVVCNWIDTAVGADEYYTMHAQVTAGAVIIASEPGPSLLAAEWRRLGHGSIVECCFSADSTNVNVNT